MVQMRKRGVSPLIATVLLVMIVVSIGAAVMVVIQSLSEEQLASASAQQALIQCGVDVDVGLIEVSDSTRICINAPNSGTGNVTLYMENKGLKNIQGWRFTVVGANGIYDVTDQGTALSRGTLQGFSFTYDTSTVGTGISSVDLIRLSPRVEGGATNPVVTCSEPNLEWDADEIVDWNFCNSTTWDDNI